MGYDLGHLTIAIRLDRHHGPEQERDDRALENLRQEIELLIKSDPDYERIASIGVSF